MRAEGDGVGVLSGGVSGREGCSEWVTAERRLKRGGGIQVGPWGGGSAPGRGGSKFKGPGAGPGLACWSSVDEAPEAGAGAARGSGSCGQGGAGSAVCSHA